VFGDLVELHQIGGETIEVRDGEKGILVRSQDGLLLPGERLAADLPGPVGLAVSVCPLSNLGQPSRQAGHVIEGLHEDTVLRKLCHQPALPIAEDVDHPVARLRSASSTSPAR
jgi:hypothetical protein